MINLLKSTKSIVVKNMRANFLSGRFATLHKKCMCCTLYQIYSFQFGCHGKIPVHFPSKYVKDFLTNGHLGTNRSNSFHFLEKNVMFDTI